MRSYLYDYDRETDNVWGGRVLRTTSRRSRTDRPCTNCKHGIKAGERYMSVAYLDENGNFQHDASHGFACYVLDEEPQPLEDAAAVWPDNRALAPQEGAQGQ